jgi:hypothetical protein
MRKEREGGKKMKKRTTKNYFLLLVPVLEKFQEKQLGGWKLSYLERRMRRCSKLQSLARTVTTQQQINKSLACTVNTHQQIKDRHWHVLLKHPSK